MQLNFSSYRHLGTWFHAIFDESKEKDGQDQWWQERREGGADY
jgi:hypothetical protein